VIEISRARFHCNRFTTVPDIRDYVSVFLAHSGPQPETSQRCKTQTKHGSSSLHAWLPTAFICDKLYCFIGSRVQQTCLEILHSGTMTANWTHTGSNALQSHHHTSIYQH